MKMIGCYRNRGDYGTSQLVNTRFNNNVSKSPLGNALRKAATGKSTHTALTKVCDKYLY